MATEEADSSGRYLTRQSFLRSYKWLTVLAFVAVVANTVASEVVPDVVIGTVLGCWFVYSLFVLAHFGIKNSTHGV